MEARAAARVKAAAAERRKKDGILGALKTAGNSSAGNAGKIWDACFARDTTGICLSGSAGFGAGATASACLVSTTRPAGKTDYGVKFSELLRRRFIW